MKLFSASITVSSAARSLMLNGVKVDVYDLTGLPNNAVTVAPFVAVNSFLSQVTNLKLKYLREIAQEFAVTATEAYAINAPASLVGIPYAKNPKTPVVVVLLSLEALRRFAYTLHNKKAGAALHAVANAIQEQTQSSGKRGCKLPFAAIADVSEYKKQIYVRKDAAAPKASAPAANAPATKKASKKSVVAKAPAKEAPKAKKGMVVLAAPMDLKKVTVKKSSLALLQAKKDAEANVMKRLNKVTKKINSSKVVLKQIERVARRLAVIDNARRDIIFMLSNLRRSILEAE